MGDWLGKYKIAKDPYDKSAFYHIDDTLMYITDNGHNITITTGFTTDGASIPWFMRWYASPFAGPWAPASAIHDGLYQYKHFSRKETDDIFLEAMLCSKVRKGQAYVMWFGVRLGGWLPWSRYNHNNIALAKKHVSVKYIGLHNDGIGSN